METTIIAKVEDKPGVLNRIASMFRRRKWSSAESRRALSVEVTSSSYSSEALTSSAFLRTASRAASGS